MYLNNKSIYIPKTAHRSHESMHQIHECIMRSSRCQSDRKGDTFYISNYINSNSKIQSRQELYGHAFSALWRPIVEVKRRWSVIGWVTKNLLSRAPPCFGWHIEPLVPAAFAVVSTHQSVLGPAWWVMARSPYMYHKEGLCCSNGDINRLMMMMMMIMMMTPTRYQDDVRY
jgi:hypothetical protein